MPKSILFCFAHPDDEVGCGPLVSLYNTQGVRSTLICTTNGDVGTVDPKHMVGYNTIAELRLKELECATSTIGFSDVVTFGYRDSGMMGSADNDHPESSWQVPLEKITERVMEVMRRVRPQVVVTFNTYGAYGHPDHIKINQATVAAFQKMQSEPDHPQKLYYTNGPKNLFRIGITLMKIMRRDPRKAGTNNDLDLQAAYDAIDATTAKIPVAAYLDATRRAAQCHASQMSGFSDNLPSRLFMRFMFGTMLLGRVYPEVKPGEPVEHDLFENVQF